MKHQFAYATSVKRGIRWLAKRDRKALLKICDVPFIGQHPCAVDDDHLKLVPVAREADTIGQISGDEVPKRRKRNPGVLVIPIGLEYGTILILDNHVAMRPLAKNSSSISSLPGSAS